MDTARYATLHMMGPGAEMPRRAASGEHCASRPHPESKGTAIRKRNKGGTHGEPPVLISATHPIGHEQRPHLVELAGTGGERVDRDAHADACRLLAACRTAGFEPVVTSAWRSHARQAYLLARRTAGLMARGRSPRAAWRLARRFVALPGTSEHELGLALDLRDASGTDAANDALWRWLSANAWRYGFVMRYPADKAHLTGIASEPWHFRHVGRAHAQAMHAQGLCLEEYLAQQDAKTSGQP